jgi:3-hydroxyacyl-CoA dehydrogenase
MKFKNVTVAGGGTLGSQIAWQTAFNGFEVTVYGPREKGLEACKQFHQQFAELFVKTRGASQEEIDQTMARLHYTTDLAEAVKDADILSESVPENIEIKKNFYQELAKVAPKKTIFTTDSSTMLPSYFAADTGRPEKFLALHFANPIWNANIGEVMGHPGTSPEVFDRVLEFASQIGMVPIPIRKEQNGYVINTLLGPLLRAAGELLLNDVSDYESIDKTWMISSGMKFGPFGIIDLVGIETIYNVNKHWGKQLNDQTRLNLADFYKKNYLDKGKLGMKSNEGFYKYPNPLYQDPDFLK